MPTHSPPPSPAESAVIPPARGPSLWAVQLPASSRIASPRERPRNQRPSTSAAAVTVPSMVSGLRTDWKRRSVGNHRTSRSAPLAQIWPWWTDSASTYSASVIGR